MDSLEALTSRHQRHLKGMFFGSSDGSPKWLEQQALECTKRYGGLKIIPQFRSAINAFSETSTKPFELFVLGEGKFGKSTLVNALLGEERSRVRGLPETRCFLRYEITDEVNQDVQMFMRFEPGTHDWIKKLVDRGTQVADLFEILRYTVSRRLASRLLDEEAKRMNQGGYEPAIFEAQRFVPLTRRTAFPAGVRIVDTQGLDQLFPEDLRQLGAQSSNSSTTDLFLNWMSNTPRGKHLEWQYRRCDAVLWCINAKRLGSAATEASLKYFSNYSKKIVIALTNVDLVARSDMDRRRIIEHAHRKYGNVAASIVAVNGAEALRSVLEEDAKGINESGLSELKDELVDACVTGGAMTRSVSCYLGLRETEWQFRRALSQMRRDLSQLKKKHESDLSSVSVTLRRSKGDFSNWINSECGKLVSGVHSRIELIDLSDDSYSTKTKIRVDEHVDSLRVKAQEYFKRTVRQNAQRLADSITPYSIPKFDAEGNVNGHLKKVHIDPQIKRMPSLNLSFNFWLNNDIFYRATLWFKREVLGLFSAAAKQNAQIEEYQAIQDRQQAIRNEFNRHWQSASEIWIQRVLEAIEDLYKPISSEIGRVLNEVELLEGESLDQSCDRISKALARRSSNSVFMEQFIRLAKMG